MGVEIGPGGSKCGQSDDCEKMGPEVDNDIVVDVSDGGNFMPSDDFKYPTAVVIKTGGGPNEQHFIYSPAGSFDCDFQVGKDPYCVAFEDDGSFTVTLNPCYALVGAKNNCQPAHGISHIQIWKNGEDVDICECRELGVAAVTNGNCVCDGPVSYTHLTLPTKRIV